MNKYKINCYILFLALMLISQKTMYGCYGCDGGAWVAPALFGTALTTAAIASSNRPQTVIVQESDDQTSQATIKRLEKENKELRKQIKHLERQINRLERKITA